MSGQGRGVSRCGVGSEVLKSERAAAKALVLSCGPFTALDVLDSDVQDGPWA
jgi:hypothetical protein